MIPRELLARLGWTEELVDSFEAASKAAEDVAVPFDDVAAEIGYVEEVEGSSVSELDLSGCEPVASPRLRFQIPSAKRTR